MAQQEPPFRQDRELPVHDPGPYLFHGLDL
jgi:hypothetical protein